MVIIKDFALDNNGDVIIENGDIKLVHGAELTAQKLKCVLGTQKGEWFVEWEEGINLDIILGKKHYATKNSALENQYIEELNTLKQANAENNQDLSALNELLAKRLDGES